MVETLSQNLLLKVHGDYGTSTVTVNVHLDIKSCTDRAVMCRVENTDFKSIGIVLTVESELMFYMKFGFCEYMQV